MLKKGAIVVLDPKEDQFLSSLFLVKRKDVGESTSSQPKGYEQQYSVSALQDGRDVSIKGNVATRGQNVQDRPKGCLLCNRTVSEVQEVCQIPVESSSIRVLLPLPRDFSSSSGFYKAIKAISLLRKLNIRIIIYLHDMLLMAFHWRTC